MALIMDMALEGFRIIRQRPILIVYWGLLSLVRIAGGIIIIAYMAGGPYMEYLHLPNLTVSNMQDPVMKTKIMGLMQAIAPAAGIVAILSIFTETLLNTAIFRSVLTPDKNAFGYIRLGKDEFNQIIVTILMILFMFALASLLSIVLASLGAIFATSPSAQMAITSFSLIIVYGVMFYVFIRLSLAWVVTFHEKRIQVFSAWHLTKGTASQVFMGYFFACLMAVFVSTLVYVVFSVIGLSTSGLGLENLFKALNLDVTTLNSLLSISTLLYIAAFSIISPLAAAQVVGASAVAYKRLKNV